MWPARSNASSLPSAHNTSDPDELFQCPYHSDHMVRASRFSQHLKKCSKIYGKTLAVCPYNGSHHIPADLYDNHLITCIDKHQISQDIERDMGMIPQLPKQKIICTPTVVTTEDDWEEEADRNIEAREYEEAQDTQYYEAEENYAEEAATGENVLFNETILAEKPPNWQTMTPSQKTNYKRKYKRQQERMQKAGFTVVESRTKNPEDWTEEERNNRLDTILAKYPYVTKANRAFTDYKSLLNTICQKLKIPQPIYKAAPPDTCYGGFGAQCIVKSEAYYSHGYERTKQAAEHNAAKWALLSIDIPLDGTVEGRVQGNITSLRVKDELRLLQVNTKHQTKSLRQPNTFPAAEPTATTNQVHQGEQPILDTKTSVVPNQSNAQRPENIDDEFGKALKEAQGVQTTKCDNGAQDEWHTVPGKKKLDSKGRGRGRGRYTWGAS